jgi:nicotinamide-nucleotide amidase
VSARAGVVVTGTEVLTGRVQDRNGPWLADRLLELGIELSHITICGDRPEDMTAAIQFQADQGCDLIVTSGGLGPTADDLTMEIVAEFCGRAMVHDPELEERIQAIVRPILARYPRIDEEALRKGSEKQATVPEGAAVLEPAGTAPGAVVTPVDKDRALWTTSSGRCGCSGCPSRRSPRRCGWPSRGCTASTGSRSRRACGGGRWRS